MVKENGSFAFNFPYTDHLGSILTVTNASGAVIAEQNFDAWGRRRNVSTWDYASVGAVPDWLYRGYTGHEHLPEFGLINMNARLYDPVLGRMLSPDNYVGDGGTQGFNRYSYAGNNPLNRVDPDGNWVHIVVGAVIGGLVNLGVKAYNGQINSLGDGLAAFGIGALGGAITAATGGAAAGAIGLGTTGIASGIVTGGVGGIVGAPITGIGNSLYFGDPSYSFNQWGKDILMGAAIGGIASGGAALLKGQNVWWGNSPLNGQVAAMMTKQSLFWSQKGYVEQISQVELDDLAKAGIRPNINHAAGVATKSETFILPGNRMLTASKSIWNKKFDAHASDFGINDTYKVNGDAFRKAVADHINDSATEMIYGNYYNSGNPSIFYVNRMSGLTVISDLNGVFRTGFRASSPQLHDLFTRNFLR